MTVATVFLRKKEEILKQLAVPEDYYDDLSPKGSVDAEIRDFVDEINAYDGLVTTSSCSGRVSVFLEGRKGIPAIVEDGDQQSIASIGGKGGGGRWLFVEHHHPVCLSSPTESANRNAKSDTFAQVFGLHTAHSGTLCVSTETRFVHFKFEPMILHILAASMSEAKKVLSAAQQAGFRESGIGSIQGQDGPVMIAVRTTGLAFDNIIGMCIQETAPRVEQGETLGALVGEEYLRMLVTLANEKFKVNSERTERFRRLLSGTFNQKLKEGVEWEDASVRRERKRAEGLRRQDEIRTQQAAQESLDNKT